MSKKITVTLDKIGEKHFNDVAYSLDLPNKNRVTQSDCINHCLMECKMFEDITGDQITNWLNTFFEKEYAAWIKKNNIKQF
jgi:hypothetical protein